MKADFSSDDAGVVQTDLLERRRVSEESLLEAEKRVISTLQASGANQLASLATRLVEIPVALIALIVTTPIMIVIAIIIKRGTPGPALFFQDRIGVGGRRFRFVKFRTLFVDARQRFPEWYRYQYDQEEMRSLKFKVEQDPRVTPQGNWLRKTSLDELPNFWNVLTGDMALVGPRPEIPEMLRYYKGQNCKKFSVRPGVTGMAQISGRGRLRFRDTVSIDLKYVRTRSFWKDIRVLLKTLKMILLRDGAF